MPESYLHTHIYALFIIDEKWKYILSIDRLIDKETTVQKYFKDVKRRNYWIWKNSLIKCVKITAQISHGFCVD